MVAAVQLHAIHENQFDESQFILFFMRIHRVYEEKAPATQKIDYVVRIKEF